VVDDRGPLDPAVLARSIHEFSAVEQQPLTPGEHNVARSSPGGAKGFEVCRPFGAGKELKDSAGADARGYSLLPLRG
jgi:hypothetical protein